MFKYAIIGLLVLSACSKSKEGYICVTPLGALNAENTDHSSVSRKGDVVTYITHSAIVTMSLVNCVGVESKEEKKQ